MLYSRRNFIKGGGATAVGATFLNPNQTTAADAIDSFQANYSDRQELVYTAIQAALAEGATYADARLSHLENMEGSIYGFRGVKTEHMAFGVRALYNGYWGFASSPVWNKKEAVRLGNSATRFAKFHSSGNHRETDLAHISNVSSGEWNAPVKYDPFEMNPDEISDFFSGLSDFISRLEFMNRMNFSIMLRKVSKSFGSSLNQFTSQVTYNTGAFCSFSLEDNARRQSSPTVILEDISPSGFGFEYFRDRPIRDFVLNAHAEAVEAMRLPVKPVDPGRYSILIDQNGISNLISESIGSATESDRVFGFEANSGGTSYIDQSVVDDLGNFKIGSTLLNVSADRSQKGAIGMVKWDDEGVIPERIDLVKNGVVVDLQTDRESASWIKEYYQKAGKSIRSSGSSSSPSAMDPQIIHKADLSLQPSNNDQNLDDMREDLGSGIEFRFPQVSFDFQKMTGNTTSGSAGTAYEIKDGKRVSRLSNAGLMFRTPELWSNLEAIGGARSVKYLGIESKKGQPAQEMYSAVYAPPARFRELTVIDFKRKA